MVVIIIKSTTIATIVINAQNIGKVCTNSYAGFMWASD